MCTWQWLLITTVNNRVISEAGCKGAVDLFTIKTTPGNGTVFVLGVKLSYIQKKKLDI